jgi:glutamate 5-kinase
VSGSFGEGDTVEIRALDGTVFARGMVYVTATELRAVAGRQTRDLPDGMPHEVVHRDDLVILSA